MDQVLRSDPPAIGRASGEASVPSRLVLTSLFLALALVTEGALAVSWTRGAGSVTVVARAREGMRIEGKGRQISFAQDESALTFRVPLSPLETGISQRDLHLQKLLEADKYPEAILRVPRSELTLPAEQRPAILHVPSKEMSAVVVCVGAGSRFEPAHANGLAHLLEHGVFLGAGNRD